MSIREWREQDIPALMNLLKELSESIDFNFHDDFQVLKKQFDEMNTRPDVYKAFVYEKEGKVIGFISLVFYNSVLHKKGTVVINELVVSKVERSKGAGKELVKYAIEHAEKGKWDEIEVGAEIFNKKAVEFYRKNGFDREYILFGKDL